MPDTAADILAPPDPTWNPPPTDTGILSANPQPDMLAARGASDAPPPAAPPQPPDPNMISPAGAAAPYTPPPQFQPPTPQEEGAKHESFLHHILDKVGSILGGEQTIHVTRDADGNLTVSHDPSTTGEKWGRVAMAALGGAAKGAAASQGPGGIAKAASAGAEWGMQLPQQMREQADAQVTADQKRQMMNANNALIGQRGYQEMLTSQGLKLDLDTKSAGILENYRQQMLSSPNAKDYGVISSPDDLMRIENRNTDFLHKHTNLELKAVMAPKKGGGFELHAIATDPGDDARRVGEGDKIHDIKVDPATGKASLIEIPVAKGSHQTKLELRVANSAKDVQFAELSNKYAQAHKEPAGKEPTTQDAAIIKKYQLMYPNDPQRALTEATEEIQKRKLAVKETGGSEGTWQLVEDPTTGGTKLFNSKSGQEMDAPANISRLGTKAKQDAAIEKTTKPAKDAMEYADIYMNQGAQNPNAFTGAGDEALLDKYFELAKPSSGFRMSGPQQNMLINARGWMGSLRGRAYHELHGTWFDPTQRQEIVTTMGNLATAKGVTPGGGGGGAKEPPIPAGRFRVKDKNGVTIGHSADPKGTDYKEITPGGK